MAKLMTPTVERMAQSVKIAESVTQPAKMLFTMAKFVTQTVKMQTKMTQKV